MPQPRGAGGGRRAAWLGGAGLLLAGLGGLGGLPLLAAGAGEAAGPGLAREILVLFPALAILGLSLGAGFGLVLAGSSGRGRVALLLPLRLLALAAAVAPAGLALLDPADPLLLEPMAWRLPAALGALGLGLAIGRSVLADGAVLGLTLLGGAAGAALGPVLVTTSPDLAPPLGALLALLATATLLGHLLLTAHDLGVHRGPALEAPVAALYPRLAGCFLSCAALLGVVVLSTEALWAGLAPGGPVAMAGLPVLGAVTCAGLGLGALVLAPPLARGGPVAAALLLSLGLAWWLVRSEVAAAVLFEALPARPRPTTAPTARAADLALSLGPLLLALGAAPVALGGRIRSLGGVRARRAVVLAWLLPLGFLADERVSAALHARPVDLAAGLAGLLLLLVFLDADRPVARIGPARGSLGRFGAPVLRLGALASLAMAGLMALGGTVLGPLVAWHAPVELVSLQPGPDGHLAWVEPRTGELRRRAIAEPRDEARADERDERAVRSLLRGLGTIDGPAALVLDGSCAATLERSLEDLRGLDRLPGQPVAVALPTSLPPERFTLALDTFAAALPATSAWLHDGAAILVGGDEHSPPDLEDLDRGLALLADFVGVLAPAGTDRRGRFELRPSAAVAPDQIDHLRRRARNLEHFLARATPMPVAWGPLLAGADGPLAGHPVLAAGRRLRQARLAHAWLEHHAAASPGSLALETWQGRFDDALAACFATLPGHGEALALAEQVTAEADARRGLELVAAGEAGPAIPLLFEAHGRWPERRDLALGLALALDRAGNRSAAEVLMGDLGQVHASLLRDEVGRELVERGLAPASP